MKPSRIPYKFVPAVRLVIVAAVALAVGYWASPVLFDRVTQELIALAGLLMAAVLPTLALTATALRSSAFSVRRIIGYRDSLIHQAELWAGLFLVALVFCFLIVLGRAWAWRYADQGSPPASIWAILIARALTGLIAGTGTFLVLRAKAVFDGVVSLIQFSAEAAIEEARERVEREAREMSRTPAGYNPSPKGYGEAIDLPH